MKKVLQHYLPNKEKEFDIWRQSRSSSATDQQQIPADELVEDAGVGSALAFFAKRTNTHFLSGALGFSAGVMIYVSMIEIFFKARDALSVAVGETRGYWYTVLAFFAGMLLIALIDKLVPSFENPHEAHGVEEMGDPAAVLAEARRASPPSFRSLP